MRVLIAVASKHDATAEIGEAVGRHLRDAGVEVDVRPADDVGAVAAYDAVVIGSGVYMGKWLPAATGLIDRFQIDLRERPVWLFCSGPTGELAEAPADPPCLAELEGLVNPISHRTFGGRLDREKLGFGEKLVVGMVKAPMGDFRDWDAVEEWSREIVGELVREAVEA